jgi:hypothetical protein
MLQLGAGLGEGLGEGLGVPLLPPPPPPQAVRLAASARRKLMEASARMGVSFQVKEKGGWLVARDRLE